MADTGNSAALATEPNAFVIGWPIEHSRSPAIHGHWLAHYDLAGTYEKIAVSPDDLPDFVKRVRNGAFAGGNVTIPHKEAMFDLVDETTERAKAIGAVNTIWMQDGKLHGDNSDGTGFAANMDQQSPAWTDDERLGRPVLVLGAGGAARGIVHALIERGFNQILIANRTIARAHALAEAMGNACTGIGLDDIASIIGQVALVINTTDVGMAGDQSPPLLQVADLPDDAVISDIVYVPLETPLLKDARQCGLTTINGLGMLLHQATVGFHHWFGVNPVVTGQLRNRILADLGVSPAPPIFLGLTGSIGMGKSTTAQMFRDEGVPVHDSDAIVHELYSGDAVPLVEAEFPGTARNGVIDRAELSKHVVGNEEAMKRLEAIVHPLVRKSEQDFRQHVAEEGHMMAVMDSPLLFERGQEDRVDHIVVVTAPADVQRSRVLSRPNMDANKFETILARQMPDAEKRARADHVIDTSNGLDAARLAVRTIISRLENEQLTRTEAHA